MAKLVGQGVVTTNHGTVDEYGYWTVISNITETMEYDNGNVKQESIEAKCMDRSFDLAHQMALATALVMYREEVVDKGESSLIDAREKNGRSDGSSFSDPNTKVQ